MIFKFLEFGLISLAASRKLDKVEENFAFFRSERLKGGFVITGATSTGRHTKGPKKGRLRFDGEKVQVLVTEADVKAEESLYEAETGKCHHCFGEGKIPWSWSKDNGTVYKECVHCKGSGLAPQGEQS